MSHLIKVAVIGAGMMGKNHLRTYKTLPGVKLVGVYDVFRESAEKAAEMFGIKAFSSLEEVAHAVDAVSVVTTSVAHCEVGEFFLNKKIHCMIEKPLATTEEECQRLIDAAKKNNVVLLVGHIERFNPAVEQMGKILSDTSKIRSLTAQRMSAASGRITDVDVAMDLMIHDVEVIQSLVKSPVVNVQAAAVRTPGNESGKDYITALLEFSINVHSQGRMPYVNQENIPEWMNYGLKGSVEQLFIPTNQPLQAELSHFISCVKGEAAPRISGEDALNALRVIWKIQDVLGLSRTLQPAMSQQGDKIAA